MVTLPPSCWMAPPLFVACAQLSIHHQQQEIAKLCVNSEMRFVADGKLVVGVLQALGQLPSGLSLAGQLWPQGLVNGLGLQDCRT